MIGLVLGATHALLGAVAARRCRSRWTAVAMGVTSHAIADGIGHDDSAIGLGGQALLAAAALGWSAWRQGIGSKLVAGALGGLAPDGEVVIWKLRGGPATTRLIFPSHWQLGPDQTGHPYRFPVPGVTIRRELVLLALLAAIVALPRPAGLRV